MSFALGESDNEQLHNILYKDLLLQVIKGSIPLHKIKGNAGGGVPG